MHLLIVEGTYIESELRRKFGTQHTYDFCAADAPDLRTRLSAADVGFDLRAWPELHYELPRQPLFYDTSRASLAALFHKEEPPLGPVFGVCALPTLLDRELLETSLYQAEDAGALSRICVALGTGYRTVQDRVGLVTPRLVCVLINEACHALQEGAGTVQELDTPMQHSTYGPFTWANQIGIPLVYETLEALWQDTHEPRYKACALLKQLYLRGQQFEV
jgi:3-hydroxybutyryl-CoA dehydrogenase